MRSGQNPGQRFFDAPTGDGDPDAGQLGPITGEELQKLVGEVSALSPELLEKVKAVYGAGQK